MGALLEARGAITDDSLPRLELSERADQLDVGMDQDQGAERLGSETARRHRQGAERKQAGDRLAAEQGARVAEDAAQQALVEPAPLRRRGDAAGRRTEIRRGFVRSSSGPSV